MYRAEPLITAEELQCLLGDRPAREYLSRNRLLPQVKKPQSPSILQTLQFGAVLWLLKGGLIYTLLISPDAATLASASRYLWMRGGLELLCLLVFTATCLRPQTKTRTLTHGSLLVASTTLLMDAMSLLAVPG